MLEMRELESVIQQDDLSLYLFPILQAIHADQHPKNNEPKTAPVFGGQAYRSVIGKHRLLRRSSGRRRILQYALLRIAIKEIERSSDPQKVEQRLAFTGSNDHSLLSFTVPDEAAK